MYYFDQSILLLITRYVSLALLNTHQPLSQMYLCPVDYITLYYIILCPRCIKLEYVKEIKYLGVILDFRLKWDKHIN